VLEKYPKEVKLVHKFVTAHDFSMKAATAAMAANDQGKFWEFHDQLFDNQDSLSDAKITEIATTLKLDLNRFNKKLQDPALTQWIARDFEEAKRLGVLATPWIYVNGRHLTERSFPDLVDAINKELAK
jgi:protein-disulfide isomerase